MQHLARKNGAHENGFYTDHDEVGEYIEVLRTSGVGSRHERRFVEEHAKNLALQQQVPRLRLLMGPDVSALNAYEALITRFGTGSLAVLKFRKQRGRNAGFRAEADAFAARVREVECAEYERLVRSHGVGAEIVQRFRRRKWPSPDCQKLADEIDRRVTNENKQRLVLGAARGHA